MFIARSRARRQRFQQSRSLSLNKTLDEHDPVPSVTAKRGSFKHFAQSLARFQSLRARRLANPNDPSLGPLPPTASPAQNRTPPPFRLYSTNSRDEKSSQDSVTVLGYPAAYFQLALLIAMVIVTCTIILFYPSSPRASYLRPRSAQDGHWRVPDAETLREYGSEKCTIERKDIRTLNEDIFETEYRFRKPVIIKFDNGASDWSTPDVWTRPRLLVEHGHVYVKAGRADDIVRYGGNGDRIMTLKSFVTNFIDSADEQGEPLNIYDRDFQDGTGLKSDLNVPNFLTIPSHTYDSVTCLGGPRSGVSFHHHSDTWSGIIHGAARFFLYPQDHTPPGGVWAGFTSLQWHDMIYRHLEEPNLPLECVLDAGEILYVPEGMYVQTLSVADTVMVSAESRLQHTEEQRLIHKASENERRLSQKDIDGSDRDILLKDNVRIFQELLSMIPDNAEVQMRLGAAYHQVGELGDAERHTRHATFIDPHFVMAFLNLAQIHDQLGNAAEAERNFQVALRLNPSAWDIYFRFGDFLTSHHRVNDAVSIYREGALRRPDIPVLWERLKTSLSNTGDIQGAQEAELKLKFLRGGR